jgi:hypothetical protein
MKRSVLYSALFCGQLIVASAAQAQKSYALGIGGGATVPVGRLSDNQKPGYNAMIALAIGVSDLPVGVRFDGIYNNLSHDKATANGVDLRVSAILANLVIAFPGTNAKAYILAGGGLYNSKPDVTGAKSQNDFGFNGGLGATFGFGPFATFVESRYHTISRSESKGGVYQFVPITLGLMF